MASRIMIAEYEMEKRQKLTGFKFVTKGRCLKIRSLNGSCIRWYRATDGTMPTVEPHPIIAKGNRFDGVKARW